MQLFVNSGHISACNKTFELFPGSVEATGSYAVYLSAAHSDSPVYKLGECGGV